MKASAKFNLSMWLLPDAPPMRGEDAVWIPLASASNPEQDSVPLALISDRFECGITAKDGTIVSLAMPAAMAHMKDFLYKEFPFYLTAWRFIQENNPSYYALEKKDWKTYSLTYTL